ncbi:MAG: polymer-forming cytoskeletal protein [Myxococcota bacterium]
MAISGFNRGRSEEIQPESGVAVAETPSVAGMLSAFIDQGSEFEGKLSFRDTVRIDGHFRGEICSENTLVVGETGEIEADVASGKVVICGSLVGNVQAAASIVLHKTARVQGDLSTPSLVIEEGAVFNGRLEMTTPSAPVEQPDDELAPYDDPIEASEQDD